MGEAGPKRAEGESTMRLPAAALRRASFSAPLPVWAFVAASWRLRTSATETPFTDSSVMEQSSRTNALALDKASNIAHIPRCTNEARHSTKTANPDFFRLWRVPFSMGCGPPGTNGRMVFWGRSMLDPRDFRLRSVVWIVLAAISVAAVLRYVLHAYGGISGEDIRLNALLGAAVLGAALMATFFYRVRRR